MIRYTISSALLLLLLCAVTPAVAASPECRPCGEWQIDATASEAVEPAIDAALARYKPPRPKRYRPSYGDIASETEAEFQASLDERYGPRERKALREELQKLLVNPPRLTIRQDGEDILIDADDGYGRRVTPGEPHSRVDSLGTAKIVTTIRGSTLTISETYQRRQRNREVYTVDSSGAVLKVTRSVRRPGLREVVVHATYRSR